MLRLILIAALASGGLGSLVKRDTVSDFGLTQAEIDDLVKRHNDERVKAGAEDMNLLVWDNDLAADAMYWAKKCIFDHGQPSTPKYTKGTVGQNLGYTTNSGTQKWEPFIKWMAESDYYVFSSNQCYYPPCGHYTQAMWSTHERVGCAYYECAMMLTKKGENLDPNAKYLVCNYSPAGNIDGSKPWTPGEPCNGCPYCHEKLCVPKEQCESGAIKCECQRKCEHCGSVTDDCKCICPEGTHGEFCEYLCRNKKIECPSFTKADCDKDGTGTPKVVYDFCDVTCEKCTQNTNTSWTCGAENYQNTFTRFASNPEYGYMVTGRNNTYCAFPFRYNGKYYDSCIKYGDTDWCSLSTDYDKYKTYVTGCRKIKTTGGTGNGDNCVFPTEYKGKYTQKCIVDDSDTTKTWCGTTANYPVDKKWGYCDLAASGL
ncbi:cysteine-rich venom protein latisemin-like isoform X2 [Lineus longissimus]|uniref:cysteine-rich venom protein latisemin-like isoform X2 n=1 Tax=Lineus longissimus TaxID=88925 RepID=UPI002B4D529B